jgi:hypothetical protein
VGHSILLLPYHLLTVREPYDDLARRPPPVRRGPAAAHLVQQLQALGFEVTLTPKEAVA